MNLIKKLSQSSKLQMQFGLSVFDKLGSLVEDARNASILKLSCLPEEGTENELSTSIIFCVTLSLLLMSLILSFVFDLCYTITAI